MNVLPLKFQTPKNIIFEYLAILLVFILDRLIYGNISLTKIYNAY